MIKITKSQKNALESAGLIRYRKVRDGVEIQSPNIYVANREHMSSSKTYYVVEEARIMKFLGYWKDAGKNNKTRNNKNFDNNKSKKRDFK